MQKILLIAIILSIASCRFDDKNSTIRAYIKGREPYLEALKAKVESYNFESDPLIKSIYAQGYDAFVKSVKRSFRDNVKKEDVPAFVNEIFPKLSGRSSIEQYIESSFSYSGLFASIFTFATPIDSKTGRMFIYLGEKADLFDKEGDYMILDYEKTIELPDEYESYMQSSFMDWCPGFQHVCMGSSTSGNKYNSLTTEQKQWVYNFMGVIFYETLKHFYP